MWNSDLGGPDPLDKVLDHGAPWSLWLLRKVRYIDIVAVVAASSGLSERPQWNLGHDNRMHHIETKARQVAILFVSLLGRVCLRTKYATCLNGSDSPPPSHLPASLVEENIISKLGPS